MIAIRVARGLEQPASQPEVFTDAEGRPTAVPVLNNDGVTGRYFSSVWGTRGRWMDSGGAPGRRRGIRDHGRSSEKPRLPHVLACARLWPLCRQSPRPSRLERRQGRSELQPEAGYQRQIPVSFRDPLRSPARQRGHRQPLRCIRFLNCWMHDIHRIEDMGNGGINIQNGDDSTVSPEDRQNDFRLGFGRTGDVVQGF